jgi:hypothetical protein
MPKGRRPTPPAPEQPRGPERVFPDNPYLKRAPLTDVQRRIQAGDKQAELEDPAYARSWHASERYRDPFRRS